MIRMVQDLEARAEALLKRLKRYDERALTEFEIRSVLKEIQAIGKLNLAGTASVNNLARIDRLLKQAVAEANNIAAVSVARGPRGRS